MNHSILKAGAALLLLGLPLYASPPAMAQHAKPNPVLAELATYTGADRTQRLIEGAKKEGGLTLYNAWPPDDITALSNAFTKKYGVKVKSWRAGSEAVMQENDRGPRGPLRRGRGANNAAGNEGLRREKLLQAVALAAASPDLIPEAGPKHKEWVGIARQYLCRAPTTPTR